MPNVIYDAKKRKVVSLSHSKKFDDLANRAYLACTPAHKTKKIPRKLSARRKLSAATFVFRKERRFPIHDAYHATLALSHLVRIAGRTGPHPATAKKVLSAVKRYWPGVYACESALIKKIRKLHQLKT